MTAQEFYIAHHRKKVKVKDDVINRLHLSSLNGKIGFIIECDVWRNTLRIDGFHSYWFYPDQLELIDEAKPVIDTSKYPHKCPRCNNNAYVGFLTIDCVNGCK